MRNAAGQAVPESTVGNRFLFTGREWLGESGLYDYRNRVYSPALGRFLQTDPILFAAGDVNVYRYVANDPVKYVDPTGEIAIVLAPAIPWLGSVAVSGLAALGLWELGNALNDSSDSDDCPDYSKRYAKRLYSAGMERSRMGHAERWF